MATVSESTRTLAGAELTTTLARDLDNAAEAVRDCGHPPMPDDVENAEHMLGLVRESLTAIRELRWGVTDPGGN